MATVLEWFGVKCCGRVPAEDQRILVTGGTAGIGFALCEELCKAGCYVFLGARSAAKGEAAVQTIRENNINAQVEFVLLDVASDPSVQNAALAVGKQLEMDGVGLYAIVNNAATGLLFGVEEERRRTGVAKPVEESVVLETNVWGVQRVCEAFLPLLEPGGRVVNVASTAGPVYLETRPLEEQRLLSENPNLTLEEWAAYVKAGPDASSLQGPIAEMPGITPYCFSKACMIAYTQILARQRPEFTINCCNPGNCGTAINGMSGPDAPVVGTIPIRHLLFAHVKGQGWFYESDLRRAAPHGPPAFPPVYPGVPEYDGTPP